MRFQLRNGVVVDADDDAIGPDGLLKDGHRMRVPMQFRDSAGRVIVDEDDAMRADPNRVYDSTGALVAARPGFVGTADAEKIRRDAYETSKRELTDAWKQPVAPPVSAAPRTAAPHDRRQPISLADAQAIRDAAYREMCDELTNAWRRT
jgi:hypothetical protein